MSAQWLSPRSKGLKRCGFISARLSRLAMSLDAESPCAIVTQFQSQGRPLMIKPKNLPASSNQSKKTLAGDGATLARDNAQRQSFKLTR